MKVLRNVIAGALTLFTAFSVELRADPRVMEILGKMEDIEDIGIDVTVKAKIIMQKRDEGVKISEFILYRRDRDDTFLIVMIAPNNEKGNGYLRMEDNLWMYRRNTRTFQHLSRSDRVGDTDISAEDFESRRLTELYAPVTNKDGMELYSEEMLGKIPVYRFEVNAIVKDVSYPKHIYWVRKDNYLLLKQDSFSLSGTLMQTSYYLKYTNIRERYIPLKFIMVDQFEKGNKTIGTISGISLKPVDNAVFTKAYLENLSK